MRELQGGLSELQDGADQLRKGKYTLGWVLGSIILKRTRTKSGRAQGRGNKKQRRGKKEQRIEKKEQGREIDLTRSGHKARRIL